MGYNMSSDVALGQLSSAFTDNTTQVTAANGKIIIAITMMHDAKFEELTPETFTDLTYKGPVDTGDNQGGSGTFGGTLASPKAEIASFGTTTSTLANSAAAASQTVTSANVFPKGLTIYGRWRSFTLAVADSTGGVIAYMGK